MEQHSECRMSQLGCGGDPYDAHPRTVLRDSEYNVSHTVAVAELQHIHICVQRLSLLKQLLKRNCRQLNCHFCPYGALVATHPAMASQWYAHFS